MGSKSENGGWSDRDVREYRKRAGRARRRMSVEQRAVFDAIVIDDVSLEQAARRLGWSEQDTLRRFVAAFRIHIAEIERPARPWWHWWK